MIPSYRVLLAPDAFRDLDMILDYIRRDSPQNAARTIDRLWSATQSLDRFPHRYRVYRLHRRPELAIRAMPVPPFVIYYRIIEPLHTVRVLTVRHGARRRPSFPEP
jgi:plasmid stabilization system protein ParE